MAQNNGGNVSYEIQFVQKGLKSLEGSLVSTNKTIEAMSKSASSIFPADSKSLKSFESQINKLSKSAVGAFSKIQDAIAEIQEGIASGGLSDENALRGLKSLSREVGVITNKAGGLKQALSGTTYGVTENIYNLIANFEKLGVSSNVVSKLLGRFSGLNEILQKTGDSKYLYNFNKELEVSTKNVLKLEDTIKKLSSLDITSAKKTSAISSLTGLKDKIVSGEANPQETNNALRTSSGIYEKLNDQQKKLVGKQKESVTALDQAERLLLSQKTALENTIKSQRGVASAAEIARGEAQLNKLESKLKLIQNTKLNIPIDVDSTQISAFVSKVNRITSSMPKTKVDTESISFDIKSSKKFEDFKSATKSLSAEIDVLKNNLTAASKVSLDSLKNQLVSLQSAVASGKVQPNVAKEELALLNKKITLLREASNIQTKAQAGEGVTLSSSDVRQINVELEKFRAEVVSSSGSVNILSDKLKGLSDIAGGKITFDKSYDKIIASYQEQIRLLEKLKISKVKFASESSMSGADKMIEKLTAELQAARRAKEGFDASFATNPSAALSSATAETKKLSSSLTEAKLHSKDVVDNLNRISVVKWAQNIAARASMYASLYGGIYSVINLISNGVKYVLEFDQAVHTLSAVLDMSAASAGRLEKKLSDLGVKFGGSLKDINEAALALGRAGFDKAEVADATENIIKMARLTGDSFAVSASALITYREVFGDVKDATTGLTPSVTDLADQLAYVANQSRLSTQDIGTFSNYALAAAKSSGLTANAVSAMAISFSNAGVNASTIGTQIRRFSNVLAETSTEVTSFFRQMGVDQEMMMARMKMGTTESNAAMSEFVAKLKNMSDGDFGKITRGMDILALQSITLLRNNADEFFRHLQKLNSGVQGEVEKATFVTESFAITWEKLGNTLGVTFNQTIGQLLPFAKEVTVSVISTLTNINRNFETFKTNFVNALQVIAGATGVLLLVGQLSKIGPLLIAARNAYIAFQLAVQIGGVSAVFSTLAATIATATAGLTTFTGVFKVLGTIVGTVAKHPIILLLTGIAAAAVYATSSLNKTAGAVQNLGREGKVAVAEDNIKAIQEKIAKSAERGASPTETGDLMVALQNARRELLDAKKDLTTESAIKDAKSALFRAESYTSAYNSTITSGQPSTSMGEETKSSLIEAANSIKSIADVTLKAMQPGDSKAAELTKFSAELASAIKELSSADFKGGAGSEASQTIKHLSSLISKVENLTGVTEGIKIIGDTSQIQTQPLPAFKKEAYSGIPDVGTTNLGSIVSDKDVEAIKKIVSDISSQYSNYENVSSMTAQASNRLNEVINKVRESQEFAAKSMENTAPIEVKGLVKEFSEALKKTSNPISADLLREEYTKKAESQRDTALSGAQTEVERTRIEGAYAGYISSLGKMVSGHRTINELETEKVKLLGMSRAKVAEMTDLHGEEAARAKAIRDLEAEALKLAYQQEAVMNKRVTAMSESALLQLKLTERQADQIKAEEYYTSLLKQREDITAQIANHNKSGVKDKKEQEELEKKSQAINERIAEAYKLQTTAMKDVQATENQIVATKTKELKLAQDIEAEYANYTNRTSGYEKDLAVLKEIERLVNSAGFSEGKARTMVSQKLGIDIEDKQDNIKDTSFFSQGESNPSGIGQKRTNQNINKTFDTLDADIKAKAANDLALLNQQKVELEQNGLNMSFQQQEEAGAKMAELQASLAEAEVALAQSTEDRKNAIKAASYGADTANAQKTFDSLANIANAYYLLSGKKSKTAFKAMQAMQVASTIASTYSSAVKAYDSMASIPFVGPGLGAVAAAGAIAMGMANVAQIKAQTYHTGGYVYDDNRAGLRSDEVPAILQSGEYVLSRNDLKAINDTTSNTSGSSASPQKSEVVIVNSLDPSVIEQYLTSRAGRQIIKNAVK